MKRRGLKAHRAINDALSAWREVQDAPDLAHELFGSLDSEERDRLALRAFTDEVRAALRRKANGVPIYTSITRADTDGNERRFYKQTELFTVDDFRIAIDQYARKAQANHRVALALADQCRDRFGVQLTVPGLAVAS